jgi:beta-glucosidase
VSDPAAALHPGGLPGFPAGFLWGSGTSAHQVEGDNRHNDWWRFEQVPGHIRDGHASGAACRHYVRFDDDFALAEADGHNAHRFSIEWSRIEPERGRIDPAAVAHYHAVLTSLRRRRIEPVVTLHHFTNPLWIADHGGWESPATVDHFADFVRFAAREFGGEVDWWCTVNEPEVYAFRGYFEAQWPPAVRDASRALTVMANLLEAHGRAYRILHEEDRADADGDGSPARVGFAKSIVQLEPERLWHPLDHLLAYFEDRVYNQGVLAAAASGEIALSIPGAKGVHRSPPGLARSLDWIGLNYYTRWMVRSLARDPHVLRAGATPNDLGWEVWPEGLARALARAHHVTGVPVLVTENGIADAHDRLRPRQIVESVLHMGRAIEQGVPVLGYLHWSLMDNFEWADGYHGRFGLYAVDFTDPARPRHRRPSAELYAQICRANGLTPEVMRAAGVVM